MIKKFSAALGFAAALLTSAPAFAIPIPFAAGSFAIAASTHVHTNVQTTTSFAISPVSITLGSPTDDFAALGGAFPSSEAVTTPLVFTTAGASSFNFSDAAFGNFSATSVLNLGTLVFGSSVTVGYGVSGFFTLGSDWTNAGTIVNATETWGLTQTGGTNKAISLSGTFAADTRTTESVPEPATLALFGAGLVGLGAVRRRRKTS